MAELEIKGSRRYIKRMSKHLKKEHPSTRTRMETEYSDGNKKRKQCFNGDYVERLGRLSHNMTKEGSCQLERGFFGEDTSKCKR